MNVELLSSLTILMGVCIAGVNIIVEVLKICWFKNEAYYPHTVLTVSVIMTFLVTYAYCILAKAVFTPLLFTAAVVGGFFVAYGAMFGYDKLYGNFFKKIEDIFKEKKND